MTKTKVCNKCKKRKLLSRFSKNKYYKDGFGFCKNCCALLARNYRKKNPDKIKEINRRSILKHKKRRQLDHKNYYNKHKTRLKKQMKDYRDKNKEQLKQKRKEYIKNNREKVSKQYKKWATKNRKIISRKNNKYYHAKLKKDPVFIVSRNLRSRFKNILLLRGVKKENSILELIGCSVTYLKKHLESLFLEGMSWDNYGLKGWHIDHIKPCASFDLSDLEQQKQCFHYTNLQPLWAKDNLQKSSKYSVS